MDDHRDVGLEEQQSAIGGLGTIDAEIVEPDALGDGGKRRPVTPREIEVETRHEAFLLGALGGALLHVGVEVIDHPLVGDGEVAGIGPPVDEHDAVFAEEPVGAAVVDEARDIEGGLRLIRQIARQRRYIIDLLQAVAGMGSDRTENQRKPGIGHQLAKLDVAASEPHQVPAIKTRGGGYQEPRSGRQYRVEALARQHGDPVRAIEYRSRPCRCQPLDGIEGDAMVVGLADGDECQIVVRHRFAEGLARHDVERVELDVGTLEQELERCVGTDVAGHGEGQQAERRRDVSEGRAIDPAQLQRVRLTRTTGVAVAEQLLEDGKVQKRGRVVRLVNVFADELAPERRQIGTVELHL
jgi:hypothetical protein